LKDGSEETVQSAVYFAVLVLTAASVVPRQSATGQIPDDLISGIRGIDVSRRIFDAEQDMIRHIKPSSPIIDIYIQSLWPDTSAQAPLDDVYFLGKVSLDKYVASETAATTMLSGTSSAGRRILVDNGQKWELYPDGFISMLFVDQQDFNADTYRLIYLRTATLGAVNCLIFGVTPIKPNVSGRFTGTIWVENTNFRIIRVQGIFTTKHPQLIRQLNPFVSSSPFSLHFDCWRQMVAPDLWVPAYVTVDDNVPWKAIGGNGSTDIHYKARSVVWGYANLGSFENRRLSVSQATSDFRPWIIGLESDGLIAPLGEVEPWLDAMIQEISVAGRLNLPRVTCRILETTPVEMFHLDNTIIVSRGLLEIVPDPSVLAVLLAHEMAHMRIEVVAGNHVDYRRSLFQDKQTGDFAGFGIKRDKQEERRAAALTCGILNDSAYASAAGTAAAFSVQLATLSRQVPNLTRARFGIGLVENGRSVHELQLCGSPVQPALQPPPLELRGRYLVDVSTGELRLAPLF
jgi:hypothetical protein